MTSIEADNLQKEMDDIDGYLNAVRVTVETGHMPDMAGLDKRVAALCFALEQSEVETQQRLLPRLHALLGQLDATEVALRALHSSQHKESGHG